MLDDVRRNVFGLVEAGMAAVTGALTPARAREMARQVASGEGPRQANRIAQDLLEWSQRSREWISEAVSKEVKRQLGAIGLATKDDLVALRKRVRELERATGTAAKTTGRKSSARSGAAKRTSASSRSAPKRSTTSTTNPASRADATEATGLGDPGSSVP
jgi:polyhydroxyalkanoate synthesis regulator phasin